MTDTKELGVSVEERLAFFGRITAGVSHDINNVNAIIRELAGLMDDLFYGAEQTGQLNTEKIKEIAGKINDQTKRGEKNIKRLNRFSHSVDYPSQLFSLNSLLSDITDLSQRFARLKRITLSLELPEQDKEINSSPFLLQFAVFSCIDLMINCTSEYGKVSVCYAGTENGADISIEGIISEKNGKYHECMGIIERLISELGGEFLLQKSDDGQDTLKLVVPNETSSK